MQLRAARKPSSRRNVRLAGPGQLLYALMVDMLIGILGAVFVVRVLVILVNWRVVLPLGRASRASLVPS
jgi:hypothetical protein